MLHTRRFDHTLEVVNPIAFCVDKDARALVMLREKFQGRNYGGSFVVSVDRVTRISECCILKSNNTGHGAIEVQFEATCALFAYGDVVPNVRIVRVTPPVIGATIASAHKRGDPRDARVAVVFLPSAETASAVIPSLRLGQVVCARVVQARHPPFNDQVSAVGTVLTGPDKEHVYRVRGALTPAVASRLMRIVDAAVAGLRARAELPPKVVDFFELLLLRRDPETDKPKEWEIVSVVSPADPSWRGPAPPGGAPRAAGEELVHVLDLVKKAAAEPVDVTGIWRRPAGVCRSAPVVVRAVDDGAAADEEKKEDQHNDDVVLVSPEQMASTYLKEILEFLFGVRGMVESHHSPADVERHENIWQAMLRPGGKTT